MLSKRHSERFTPGSFFCVLLTLKVQSRAELAHKSYRKSCAGCEEVGKMRPTASKCSPFQRIDFDQQSRYLSVQQRLAFAVACSARTHVPACQRSTGQMARR